MWPGPVYHPLVRLRSVPSLLLRRHPWPAPDRIEITVDASPAATTVFIGGQLDLVTMPFLSEHLARVLDKRPRRLVLDLTGTEFLDCGSARLIAATGRSLPPGQRPVIRRAAPCVRRVFELTGLDAECEIEG
jgi:anti-sigma B factor antagonist